MNLNNRIASLSVFTALASLQVAAAQTSTSENC
jgi:hypothetical protein